MSPYGDPGLAPVTFWRLLTTWQFRAIDLIVLGPLLAGALAYLIGVAVVRRRGGDWSWWRVLSGVGAVLVIAWCTVGGVGVYDTTLFWDHMIGHLSLIMLAPAMLVGARPLTLLVRALPPGAARVVGRALASRAVAVIFHPVVALVSYSVTIVATHLTGFMHTVMLHPGWIAGEHWLYIAVGYQLFVPAFNEEPIPQRLSNPAKMLLLTLTMPADTFTGLVLLQGTDVLMTAARSWGPSAAADSQAAGAIMWVGGDGLMAVAVGALWAVWSRRPNTATLGGMLEQARLRTFTQHTGGVAGAPDDAAEAQLDDDEAALTAYNAWLRKLDSTPHRPAARPRRR
ncbi:MAG: putative copper resistance protein [Mycobacterium sp.]|nr:putative copper resistance protein [Mycobacterium sp.]